MSVAEDNLDEVANDVTVVFALVVDVDGNVSPTTVVEFDDDVSGLLLALVVSFIVNEDDINVDDRIVFLLVVDKRTRVATVAAFVTQGDVGVVRQESVQRPDGKKSRHHKH